MVLTNRHLVALYDTGGETAVICVSESTVKDAASTDPNRTAVAPVKFLPVMTTLVPPAAGPLSGSRLLMNGPSQLPGGSSCDTGAPHGGMQSRSNISYLAHVVYALSVSTNCRRA